MAENGITVVGVEVSNFHRLRVARVQFVPGMGLVRVTGKNGSGKTSLLRSLKAALGGQGEVLREAVVNDDSEDGTGSVTLKLSNGFTVERRFTEANPKGYLTVVGPDGGKHGQGKLTEWLGPLSFDPLSFFELRPERQNEILLSLGDPSLPGKLQELRSEREEVRDRRTPWIVRKRSAMKIAEPAGERPERISTRDELNRMGELQRAESEKRQAGEHVDRLRRDRAWSDEVSGGIEARIAELREELRLAEADLKKQQSDAVRLDQAIAEATVAWQELPDPSDDLVAVKARLAEAEDVERALRPWEAWDRAQAELEEAREQEASLTAEIAEFDRCEMELVASAGLPVDGLTFTGEGPQLNGRPLSVASGAERIRLAVAVALAANPELRIALVDEANDIDLEGLEALDTLAQEHGFQVWACRLGLEGAGEVVVDDGTAFDREDRVEETEAA